MEGQNGDGQNGDVALFVKFDTFDQNGNGQNGDVALFIKFDTFDQNGVPALFTKYCNFTLYF